MATSGTITASNMTPTLALDDCVYRGGRNAVLTRDADVAFFGCGARPDVDDVCLNEDRGSFVLSRSRRFPSRTDIEACGRSVTFVEPRLVSDNSADVRLGDAKLFAECVLSRAVCEQAAHLSDVGPSESSARVVLAGKRSALATPAQHPISRIVVVGAGREMVRIYATGAVASVPNQQASRHRALEGFVTLKVRSPRSFLVRQLPVSERVGPGGPVQTTIRTRRAIVRKNTLDSAPPGARAVRLERRAAEGACAHRKIKFRREHTNVCGTLREVMQ